MLHFDEGESSVMLWNDDEVVMDLHVRIFPVSPHIATPLCVYSDYSPPQSSLG